MKTVILHTSVTGAIRTNKREYKNLWQFLGLDYIGITLTPKYLVTWVPGGGIR